VDKPRCVGLVDYGGELDQKAIAGGFNDVPVMPTHRVLDHLIMRLQERRNMRASSAPICRLKPTMSVNIMAASLRVSTDSRRK